MVISRILSLLFRFVQFVCSVIVLGIIGWFISRHNSLGFGPKGRMIYTEVIAALSTLLSIVWMIPKTHNMLHYPIDLVLSLAWFAAFGALNQWSNSHGCGSWYDFSGIGRGGHCGTWRTAEAFSFIAACFFLASMILGIITYHRRDRGTRVHDEPNGTGPAGTTANRRRGMFGRKSEV